MSQRLVVLMTVSLLSLAPRMGLAKCDTTGVDAADVAAARAAVAANCDCTGAASHGAYVRCAAQQANTVLVNKSCRGAVKKCAAKSTCGKAGFVTCCRTNAAGVTKCATKHTALSCKAPAGGTACVGAFTSCCDACTATGCASSPSGAFLSNPGAF